MCALLGEARRVIGWRFPLTLALSLWEREPEPTVIRTAEVATSRLLASLGVTGLGVVRCGLPTLPAAWATGHSPPSP